MAGAGDGAPAPACGGPADAGPGSQRERRRARPGAARDTARARGPPAPPRAAGDGLLTEAAAAFIQPVALLLRAAAPERMIAVRKTSEPLDDRAVIFRRAHPACEMLLQLR